MLRPVYLSMGADPADFWHGDRPPNCAVNVLRAEDGVLRLLEEDRVYW